MNDSQRQTRSYLMQLFEQRGFHPRGDLGQNFLIDLNLIDSIVEQAELSQRDVVLEVGAGTGGLTMSLAESAGRVVSVEYDRRVYELAESALAGRDNVTLLRCDALKNKNRLSPRIVEALETALAETGEADAALKLVANLPYNIATPVISNLIASDLPWTRMIVTVQYELGRRLAAKPGTGNFGALSVWVQSQCRVKLLKKLPPNVFWPRPQVNSAVMRITLDHTRRARIEDRAFFQTYVRGVFNLRRKLLRRVLYGLYRADLDRAGIDRILEELGLDPQQRAEKMDVETHILLANRLKRKIDARPAVGSAKECC
ncbi:MAG: ribosomal RNA small subunit methyltransferase A [Planctomycetota bacterium]|nr:MAG: ribosomal RNA small subunit methyltransferase A [Planctomycetota bacterium]